MPVHSRLISCYARDKGEMERYPRLDRESNNQEHSKADNKCQKTERPQLLCVAGGLTIVIDQLSGDNVVENKTI